jgi:PAS domain S-box-containing protein
MNPKRLHILIVEDNMGDFLLIQEMLHEIRDFPKDISHVTSLQEAIDILVERPADVILLDLSLPDSYGIDSFIRLNEVHPDIPILILSGLNDTRFAHDAVKNGAQDYLVKGEFEEKLLAKSILYSIERKSSVEMLRQSQSSYKLLFESNPIPMYIRNKENFKIIKANQSAVLHFGYSEQEFIGMDVIDLHPPGEIELLKHSIETDSYNGKTEIYHHIHKNGSSIVVETRAQEIVLDGVLCVLILADDITEKRRVQEEVLFQAGILKNVRDTIFVTDLNGNITYWNEGAELSFGYLRSQITNKSFDILYSELDKPKIRTEQQSILAGKLQQWEAKLITSNNKIVWSDIKASLLFDDKGQIIGVIRVCKDITQSRYYSMQQKETVAMLNSIFNNVNQSILLIDNDLRLKAFNSNANDHHIQLVGQELEENASVLDLLLPDLRNEFTERFNESLKGNLVQWEMAYRFSPTSVHWFSVNMSPVFDDNDKVLGVCASMVNISDRKMADEQFKGQFEEIEKNNQELDRLVKILSHDLKAPMNSVSGLITLAKQEKDPAEFGTYLSMMEKSLVKLETFTNDIIASLKNRGGTLLIDIPIKRLIDEILEELRFSPGAENIRFINNLKDEKVLKSDPALIRSIFSNLISNSIKYQDANKDDHFVEISSNSYPMLLEISVKDNGIGISKELHSRIFDSYFTIEKRADSNGLGLSNVKNAVLKLQGAIEVDSIPGEFTTFLVQLPLI